MSAGNNVIIVDKTRYGRLILKNLILKYGSVIHEAADEFSAVRLISKHHPKIVFISVDNNNYWPNLVQTLKKKTDCPVVVYTSCLTRDTAASAYFSGADDILVDPVNQTERIERYMLRGVGVRVKYCGEKETL